MPTLTGNKGEWSEFYTLLKLLAEGKLYAADAELNKLEGIFYPIIKIINPSDSQKEFNINSVIKVTDADTGAVICEIPVQYFAESAKIVLEKIKASNGSFEIAETTEMLSRLNMTSFKSSSSDKIDITMVLHDINTGVKPKVGFSIKSNLGSPPTLINASRATNFTYNIVGNLTQEMADEFNHIETPNKIIDRMLWLQNNDIKLEFETVDNEVFERNLFLIDSNLAKIMAESLLLYYRREGIKLVDIVNILERLNPLNFPSDLNFYGYKIKKLLTASALGLKPSRQWGGEFEVLGGYIVVRLDGEVVCYHLYNLNQFESYLINYTKFDTPDPGRHHFAELYRDDTNNWKLKLNLQVRFIQ